MKKILCLLLILAIVFSIASIAVYADDTTKSLDEVTNENKQDDETKDEQTKPAVDDSKKFIKDLGESSNVLGESTPEAVKAKAAMRKVVSYIVQILFFAITIGMTLRVALDLTYIVLPFTRSFLGNGHIGNPQAGAGGVPQQPGMMGGFGSGFGTGFGGGFGGYGGYNRFGGGFGSPMFGGGMMNQQHMQREQTEGIMGKIQWVSTAALNAVAGESTLGPDGRPVSPLKMYAKDMVVLMVLVPVLLVLAGTGVLTQLGFLLGGLIANAIVGFGGSI